VGVTALVPASAPRLLPPITDVDRAFWTGGFDGRLLIERCVDCDRWQHPPAGRCRACDGPVRADAASGQGTVFTFTVNQHPFRPDVPPPYVIAIVELAEQRDLRVVANVVGCEPDDVHIGLAVEVGFERQGDHAVPTFHPALA
jgi:uncharacterized OB-fold protein